MSTTANPMSLRTARTVAEQVMRVLGPHCERIEVAGSIRRGKDWCNDVEIVAIPKTTVHEVEDKPATLLDAATVKTVRTRDPGWAAGIRSMASVIVRGSKLDEAKTTQFLTHEGHKVDLFTAHRDNWGYIFVIRTGPPEYGTGLLARGNKMGFKGVEGMWTKFGKPIEVREEADMFRMLGITYTLPHQRG